MHPSSSPLIAIIAGEQSGDMLGAGLLASLREHYPQMRLIGVGGPRMAEQGLQSLFPIERLSVMGITEVLGRLPELFRLRSYLLGNLLAAKPDICITIDSPDFTLPIAGKLHAAGIKTCHYVSPSVWAWRQGRVKKIKRDIDLMLTLLPFEADFYRQHQVPVAFVGHPLADSLPLEPDTAGARTVLGLAQHKPVLTLLPGSRGGEVKQLLATFFAAAQQVREKIPDLQVVIPAATPERSKQICRFLEQQPAEQRACIRLLQGQSHEAMIAADVVLLASGTASLEAMLLKKPTVVGYRVGLISYWIIKSLATTQYVALPNILAGNEELVPEWIQHQMTADNLARSVLHWFTEDQQRHSLVKRFADIHQQLKQNGNATAAKAVAALLAR